MRLFSLLVCVLWPVTVSAQAVLTVTPSAVAPGGSLSVTVTGGPGSIYDWITVAPVGSADNVYQGIWFLNGTAIPPASPLTSASFPITVPNTAGSYEVRFNASGYYVRLATSGPIAVSGTPVPPPPPEPTRIVFHGDSNTSHAYTSGALNWTAIVGTGLGYTDIQNLAVPGAYAELIKNDLSRLVTLHPDRVVLMIGTNDMAYAVQASIPHAERLGDYLRTMQTIIDTLRQAQIPTVILSPIFTLNALETARYPDWIGALKTLCLMSDIPFLDVWSHMATLAELQPKDQFESYYRVPSLDPWHLSDAGHAMLAAFVLAKIPR